MLPVTNKSAWLLPALLLMLSLYGCATLAPPTLPPGPPVRPVLPLRPAETLRPGLPPECQTSGGSLNCLIAWTESAEELRRALTPATPASAPSSSGSSGR